jgi:tRNA-splicing ligase RtcB
MISKYADHRGSITAILHPQEVRFIRRVSPVKYEIDLGFVPNMRVPGTCYVNKDLEPLLFDELKAFSSTGGHGGFLPAVKQLANVAALPGIVQVLS